MRTRDQPIVVFGMRGPDALQLFQPTVEPRLPRRLLRDLRHLHHLVLPRGVLSSVSLSDAAVSDHLIRDQGICADIAGLFGAIAIGAPVADLRRPSGPMALAVGRVWLLPIAGQRRAPLAGRMALPRPSCERQ